ncbi:hypothetical protein KAI58_02045 [Candidatus Gracilibacteria bacterium]|nr:hypothetical protein [Candidatus Gracilibacteria bacterium]
MKKFVLLGLFSLSLLFYSNASVFAVEESTTNTSTETKSTSNSLPSSQDVFGITGNDQGLFANENDIIRDYTGGATEFSGNQIFRHLIEQIIDFLKKLLAPITIALLTWSAIYLFLSRNNEEEIKKRKNEIFAAFAGFTIILLSTSLVDNIFFGVEGEILRDSCDHISSKIDRKICIEEFEYNISKFTLNANIEIEGIINFITTFAVSLSVLFLAFTTYTLILAGEDEEQTTKTKKRIIFIIIGIAILVSTSDIVSTLVDDNKKLVLPNASALLSIGGYWTNKVLGFLGLLSVTMLVWAGFQMVANFGDEEKVEDSKKIFRFVIIGLILAFSSWTIIRYFLTAG